MAAHTPQIGLIIPVFNEGENIISVITSLKNHFHTPYVIYICYDFDEDNTLTALREHNMLSSDLILVKNPGRGAHQAVLSGIAASTAPYDIVFPADDDYNAPMLDNMVALAKDGCDIVCASRFMPGGSIQGCPLVKFLLMRLANFTLRHVARLPTHDATNGFRLFSKQLTRSIPLESTRGFTYSLEWLVKAHRLGLRICETPASWKERSLGRSRFKVFRWIFPYLRWFFYAFSTTYLPGFLKKRPVKQETSMS